MGRRKAIWFQRSVKRTKGTPSRLNVTSRRSSVPGPNSSHASSWIPYWTPVEARPELEATPAASAQSSTISVIRPAVVLIGCSTITLHRAVLILPVCMDAKSGHLVSVEIALGILVLLVSLTGAAVVLAAFVWAARKDGEDDRALQRRLGIRRRSRMGR